MLPSYPERGPNLDVDFSFTLRGPLAHPIRLKVTNNQWEGSHSQIEELHRGASSSFPQLAGTGGRDRWGVSY